MYMGNDWLVHLLIGLDLHLHSHRVHSSAGLKLIFPSNYNRRVYCVILKVVETGEYKSFFCVRALPPPPTLHHVKVAETGEYLFTVVQSY